MSNELSLWHLYTRQNETDAILSSHGHDVANITGLSEVAISGDFTDLNNIPSLVNSIQGRNGNVTLSAADVDAIPSSASCNKLWNWVLKTEQPSYVWGGNEKSTMYIYNPATFNVAYATSSDTANNSKLLKNRDLCAEVDVIKSDIDNLPTSLPANGGNADTVDGKHASDFILLSTKGSASGVAELDSNGKVPSSQLPSYVDDVIEGTLSTFPTTGETGKIYVDTTTNKTYRWGGTSYVIISDTISLGETSSTAYRGDRGKVAYDHSQTTHAPSNAQKNSDITKAEIEAKLTGDITTHTHDYDNYQKWVVKVNSEVTGKDMTKGEILNIKGSGSTTVTRTGSDITISSTDKANGGNADTLNGLSASNTANNIPVLDNNAKLSIAQIPTGTTSTTVSLGDHTHEYLPTSGGTISGNLAVTGTTDFTGNVGFNGELYCKIDGTVTSIANEISNLKSTVVNGKQEVVDAINDVIGYTSELTTANTHADYAWWIKNKIDTANTIKIASYLLDSCWLIGRGESENETESTISKVITWNSFECNFQRIFGGYTVPLSPQFTVNVPIYLRGSLSNSNIYLDDILIYNMTNGIIDTTAIEITQLTTSPSMYHVKQLKSGTITVYQGTFTWCTQDYLKTFIK